MARAYSRDEKPHRVLKVDARGDYQRGEDVRALQEAVNIRLRTRGLTRYCTEVDGHYGPATAVACRKAVWALGGMLSTVRAITTTATGRLSIGAQRMIRYPDGRAPEQLRRAKDRRDEVKAAAASHNVTSNSPRARAVQWALAQVGTTENPPGSNRGGKITEWQQQLGSWLVGLPWCGVFCAAALRHAGVKGVTWRLASVSNIEDDARAGHAPFRGWTPGTRGVLRGDLVVIGGRGKHVELVEKVWADGSVDTIGGNTSPGRAGSQANGGGVFHRAGAVRRTPGEVYGFALVDYPG